MKYPPPWEIGLRTSLFLHKCDLWQSAQPLHLCGMPIKSVEEILRNLVYYGPG